MTIRQTYILAIALLLAVSRSYITLHVSGRNPLVVAVRVEPPMDQALVTTRLEDATHISVAFFRIVFVLH